MTNLKRYVTAHTSLIENVFEHQENQKLVELKEGSFPGFTSNIPNRNFFWQKLNMEPTFQICRITFHIASCHDTNMISLL